MKAAEGRVLPLMKSLKDAVAISKKECDGFFLTAFVIEVWLGRLLQETVDEYAEKKMAVDRRLQTGRARRIFSEFFGHASDMEFPNVFYSLCRFCEYEGPFGEVLLSAFSRLSYEELLPKLPESKTTMEEFLIGVAGLRDCVDRLCDWVEAFAHWTVHGLSYCSPVMFDQDPDKRELAGLGVNQRHFANMSALEKEHWYWIHDEVAAQFKDSPKWRMVGQGMVSEKTRVMKYPELDMFIISSWPLVKKHDWTYRDLSKFATTVLQKNAALPVQREQDLATYCNNVLGLRKESRNGVSAKDGQPPGFDIALRIFNRRNS